MTSIVHYCPVNSFPTNPTRVGMRDPRNPPSWIRCYITRSEVFFFTNFLKQCLSLLNLSFSSSLTGILLCNILCKQSQIQWTSSIPPSSIIRLHLCLSCLTSLIAFNSRENTGALWAIIEEWTCTRCVHNLYYHKHSFAYKLVPR